MPETFDVFLSHNSQDKPLVKQIGSWLEAREISVWLDEWELRPGFPWQEGLEEGIRASRAGAVFVGLGGLGSWQIPEMRAFIARSRRENIPVIPVLLPGCPDSPELTVFLEAFSWVDLRTGVTDEGLQRLVWGINGTRPERQGWYIPLRRAGSEPLTPLLLHPPEAPAFFAGRDHELHQLEQALASRLPCVVVVLGMGGQGKTTLVAQWVRTREPIPFDALFWCTAYRGGFSFDTFLDAALDYLERGEFDKRLCPEPSARVERLLRRLQERRTMLVIDGVERWLRGWARTEAGPLPVEGQEHRKGQMSALDEFLMQATGLVSGSHVVLTSRALPEVLDHAEYVTVPLDEAGHRTLEGLSDAAAAALLRSFGVQGDSTELSAIASAYANHPLALTVLAALITQGHRDRLPAAGEISALAPRKRLFQLLEEARQHFPDRKRAERFLQVASICMEHPTLTTLSAVLSEAGPSWRAWAARWLRLALPQPLIQDNWDLNELRGLAGTLAKWHLIDWSETAPTVRLHPAIKEFFAGRAFDAGAVHRAFGSYYARLRPAGELSSMAEVQPRILAIDHMLATGDAEHAAALLFSPYTSSYTFVEWLSAWGHHAEGIRLMGRVAEIAPDSTKALCLLGRASLLLETRRALEALADLVESVRILENGPVASRANDRRNLARALTVRGSAFREIAETSKGLADLDRAVSILEQDSVSQPDQEFDLARSLLYRAIAAWELGRWSAALRDHNRAELIATQAPGQDRVARNLFLAGVRANRGVVHADLGNRNAAIHDFEEAISTYEPLVKEGRLDLALELGHARVMLATVWTGIGQIDAAIHLSEQALEDLTLQVQEGRTEAEALQALARLALAAASVASGRSAEAVQLADEAVGGYRRIVDAGAPEYAGLLANSLFTRAAARHAADDANGSRADREEAFGIVRLLGNKWLYESDAQLVLLRKQLEALRYLLPAQKENATRLLAESLGGVARALQDPQASEGLRIEAQRTLAALLDLQPTFAAAGIATAELMALQVAAQNLMGNADSSGAPRLRDAGCRAQATP